MGIEEVLTLSIVASANAPSRASFGTPLLMCFHSVTPDLLLSVSKLTELTDAGFAVTSPAYRMATVAFSQNPRPQKVVIGKRTHSYTQIVELSPTVTTVGFVYAFTMVDYLGVATDISYTVQGGDTISAICAALTALIISIGVTPVATPPATASTKVVCTTTAGKLTNYKNLPRPQYLKIADVSTDPGIAADLSAIEALDDTSWYGIAFDHSPKTVIVAAAAWVEARRKIALCDAYDSACNDSTSTTDSAYVLKGSAYVRTETRYAAIELLSYGALGWMALMLAKDPGSATWAFKTIAGVPADVLTSGQKSALTAKNCNTYTEIGGKNVTQWGQTPDSGYIDICHGTDWLFARIQEAIWLTVSSADKIPFTDSGVDTLRNAVGGALDLGVAKDFLAADPHWTITFPKVKDVSDADKLARNLPSGEFAATLAGAIHTLQITGSLSV